MKGVEEVREVRRGGGDDWRGRIKAKSENGGAPGGLEGRIVWAKKRRFYSIKGRGRRLAAC